MSAADFCNPRLENAARCRNRSSLEYRCFNARRPFYDLAKSRPARARPGAPARNPDSSIGMVDTPPPAVTQRGGNPSEATHWKMSATLLSLLSLSLGIGSAIRG